MTYVAAKYYKLISQRTIHKSQSEISPIDLKYNLLAPNFTLQLDKIIRPE